jgi:NAD(P)-dependent dehydrogenase (short-subunit alcohol dehydrogenase family)
MNLTDLFTLEGRTALVTGGSRGIGRMIVEGFIAAGCARVYISARKQAEIDATVAALGDRVVGIPMDLGSVDACRALAADIAAREAGRLDILVNNAGAAWGEEYDSFPEEGWDKVMDLNVKSLFFLTQALTPALRHAATFDRPAKVINIASIDGLRVNPWETYSYQASKAAVIHLTRRMAARLVRDNILATAICPGAFPSNMNKVARDHGDAVAKNIPFPRTGNAEDMAGAAIFLASRAGDYVVGSALPVDGGVVNAALPGHGIAAD